MFIRLWMRLVGVKRNGPGAGNPRSGCVSARPRPGVPLAPGIRKVGNGPGATRTRDLLLRRQALYPTELRTLGWEEKSRRADAFAQRREDLLRRASLLASGLAQGIHVGRNGVQLGLVQVGATHRRHDPGMLFGSRDATRDGLLNRT
jgi:hypothetical protein